MIEEYFSNREECEKEANIDVNRFQDIYMKKANWDHESMCFLKCISIKSNTMNEDGEPQMDTIIDFFASEEWDTDTLNAFKKNCTSIQAEDLCERAYLLHEYIMSF